MNEVRIGQYYRRACGTLFKVTRKNNNDTWDGYVIEGSGVFDQDQTYGSRYFEESNIYELIPQKLDNFSNLYQKLL